MCLGIPGRVVEVRLVGGIRMGTVDYGGIARDACLELAPEVDVGAYVVVHAGFAVSTLGEEDARRTSALLADVRDTLRR